jgi:hypothetical protein
MGEQISHITQSQQVSVVPIGPLRTSFDEVRLFFADVGRICMKPTT